MNDAVIDHTGATVQDGGRQSAPWWFDAPAVGGWTLGFALVVILGLSGGGYDTVVRGEVGIAAWWIAGLGVALGALALPRSRVVNATLGLFIALTVWTTLGLTWTESTERTVAEAARTAGYLGVFLLTVLVCVRTPARHVVAGLAAGLTLVGFYAVLTRLHPDWFDTYALNDVFPTARRRLSQPVGYWNALAGLLACGIPLLLFAATEGRRLVVRALAASVVPVLVLAVFLTVSRGGVIAVCAAAVVWFALAPDRLPKLPVVAVVALGSALVCIAADDLEALQAGLETAVAREQGRDLQTTLMFAMAGVGLVTAAVGLLEKHTKRPAASVVPRRGASVITCALLVVGVVAALVAGGVGWAGDRFDEFKSQSATPSSTDNSISRLSSVGSNGRYRYWVEARNAQRRDPFTGIGPGTFEYFWAREKPAEGAGFVRDAHSLWAEALGEMGLIGFGLVVGLFCFALVAGAGRALRSTDREHRGALGAAVAGLTAFVVIASVEWAWEMTVLGATGVALAGVCVAGRSDPGLRLPGRPGSRWTPGGLAQRVLVGLAACVAVAGIAIPTSSAADLRDSHEAIRAGQLQAAYRDARAATRAQPYSAAALMQEALVLERAGALERARAVAARATEEEPVNWRTWLVRSRLDARVGNAAASVEAYRRARALNPRSAVFGG